MGMFPVFDIVEMTGTLGSRLSRVHAHLKSLPGGEDLCRISLAAFDRRSGRIRTFAFSNNTDMEISNIELAIEDVPSLKLLAETRSYRKIDDVRTSYDASREYSAEIIAGGVRSSLTFPVRRADILLGFVFFNASRTGFFDEARIDQLSPYVAMVSLLMIDELVRLRLLTPVA